MTNSSLFSQESILFEDNHLLIACKPCGIPTQNDPTSRSGNTVGFEDNVKEYIKERDQKKGGVFLTPIFRLDKPVSGIVLFAKSQKALSRLQEIQRAHAYKKEYAALVTVRKDAPYEGLFEDFIIHDEHKARIVTKASERDAKLAKLRIMGCENVTPLLGTSERIYLVHIELLTGRYHQIRAQLSSRGWPILGDVKYGGLVFRSDKLPYPFHEQAIALHHRRLCFQHPVKKEGAEPTSPLMMTSKAPWEPLK